MTRANAVEEKQESGRGLLTLREARVVLPTASALFLCNMNRVCLSVAVVPIAKAVGWTTTTAGVVQSSFLWGYMATQVPGGVLSDKIGGKKTLGFGIALFSLANASFPLAFSEGGASIGWALALRALVGMGEGVAMPTMNNLVASNVIRERRSAATGMAFTGFHAGTMVGLVLSPFVLQRFGWEALFVLYGGLGLPFLLMWLLVVPAQGASGGGEEGDGWKRLGLLFKTPAPWAVAMTTGINHFSFFILLNWLPTYFNTALGLDLSSSTAASVLPWLAMAVCSSFSGAIADIAIRSGINPRTVRITAQSVAFLGPAAMLAIISCTDRPMIAILCFTLALAMKAFGQAGFVANQQEIAPSAAGRLSGICNTFGSLMGSFGTALSGFLVERTGSWRPAFYLMIALYLFGTSIWSLYCTTDPIV